MIYSMLAKRSKHNHNEASIVIIKYTQAYYSAVGVYPDV